MGPEIRLHGRSHGFAAIELIALRVGNGLGGIVIQSGTR
jgi:hypothetical protein